MNVYSVRAKIYVCDACDDCGEFHPKHYRYGFIETNEEAPDAKTALEKAIKKERENRGKWAEVTLDGEYKPVVEFIREISETEKMIRMGVPQLF